MGIERCFIILTQYLIKINISLSILRYHQLKLTAKKKTAKPKKPIIAYRLSYLKEILKQVQYDVLCFKYGLLCYQLQLTPLLLTPPCKLGERGKYGQYLRQMHGIPLQ